jgi:hypothetical protein
MNLDASALKGKALNSAFLRCSLFTPAYFRRTADDALSFVKRSSLRAHYRRSSLRNRTDWLARHRLTPGKPQGSARADAVWEAAALLARGHWTYPTLVRAFVQINSFKLSLTFRKIPGWQLAVGAGCEALARLAFLFLASSIPSPLQRHRDKLQVTTAASIFPLCDRPGSVRRLPYTSPGLLLTIGYLFFSADGLM